MSTSLNLVTLNDQPEPVAQRVQRLQTEARQLARDHIGAFARMLADTQAMAAEIAEGGEVYPAGIRDLARRFSEDAETRVQTLATLAGRSA
ncbi:MAG TPA: hypothetical protein VF122_03065 [Caulobacteraceae bacterium]